MRNTYTSEMGLVQIREYPVTKFVLKMYIEYTDGKYIFV